MGRILHKLTQGYVDKQALQENQQPLLVVIFFVSRQLTKNAHAYNNGLALFWKKNTHSQLTNR